MSDEEKKAIESFKEENNNDLSRFDDFNSYTQFKVKRDKLIIDLIEKQSKEIEELKQNIHLKEVYVLKTNDYIKGTNIEDELCNKKWEDKIKAKIEELKKLNDEATSNCYGYGIHFLQSLLGKE